jgi:hypothetical protein
LSWTTGPRPAAWANASTPFASAACETCAYFRTGTEFLPVLVRQRDHARDHGQSDRAALFDGLIQHAENERNFSCGTPLK